MLDYYEIGQRIRRFRKAAGLSQEQLAEKIDISTTHMSHIETGNTKLSLPVLVELAQVLGVSSDDLLFDISRETRITSQNEISLIMEQSTPEQVKVLSEIVKAGKRALDAYLS